MKSETPESLTPVCWRREWNGDDSDLGAFVHADHADELDHDGPWEALYSEQDVRSLESSLQQARRERDEWETTATNLLARAESAERALAELQERCAALCESVHDDFGWKREYEAATGAAVCATKIRALKSEG